MRVTSSLLALFVAVAPVQAQRAESVGGVIERPGPIHVSNVALIDPSDNKPTRVGIERIDGKAFRVSRRTKARID